MQPQSTESAGKIGVINGLRGVAILGVVFHHLFSDYIYAHVSAFWWHGFPILPYFIFSNAHQGVILFFLLSGFVLSLPYFSGRRAMHSYADAYSFYRRRLQRLLPLYAFFCLLGLFFVYPHDIFRGIFLLSTFTYIFHVETFFPLYNPVFWTLAFELWFSLLMPLLIVLIRRYGIHTVLLTVLALSLSVRIAGHLSNRDYINIITNNPLGWLDTFVCGIYLAHQYCRGIRMSSDSFWIGCLGILAGFYAQDVFRAFPALPYVFRSLYWTATELGLVLVIGSLFASSSAVRRFLEWPSLQMIGLMCYSIYLWHFILLKPLHASVGILHGLIYIVTLFALSFLTYRYVEFPYVKNVATLLPEQWKSFRLLRLNRTHKPSR